MHYPRISMCVDRAVPAIQRNRSRRVPPVRPYLAFDCTTARIARKSTSSFRLLGTFSRLLINSQRTVLKSKAISAGIRKSVHHFNLNVHAAQCHLSSAQQCQLVEVSRKRPIVNCFARGRWRKSTERMNESSVFV